MFDGCCGTIDGFFQSITCPTIKEVSGNVIAYYSNHYESDGLNFQVACDVNLLFLFFGVVRTGKTNNNVALPWCGTLYDRVTNLPTGLNFVGDTAYTLLDTLLIPFTRSQRDDVDNDTYNFYLSQLWICIEMVFGRLVPKWGILQKNMAYKLATTSIILQAYARLHDLSLNNDCYRRLRIKEAIQQTMIMTTTNYTLFHMPQLHPVWDISQHYLKMIINQWNETLYHSRWC